MIHTRNMNEYGTPMGGMEWGQGRGDGMEWGQGGGDGMEWGRGGMDKGGGYGVKCEGERGKVIRMGERGL